MGAQASDGVSFQARAGRRRRAATQQDLLDATVRLLEAGETVARLSIDRIVTEAGVARTTFYLHFTDKLDLLRVLAEDRARGIEDAGWRARRRDDEPELSRAAMGRAVAGVAEIWVRDRAVLAAIIETAEHDPRMRELWQAIIRRLAASAAELLQAHWTAHPELAPKDPAAMAEAMTWMIERTCHQAARDADRLATLVDAMTEICWRMLGLDVMADE
ncbi:MAG: TetR/AcrR family transcriptional regulator [Solirubrobacteraceae bacterium]